MKSYYHITPIENVESIKANGLINGGEGIFVIDTDDLFVIKNVAFNQIFCPEVAVFQIDISGFKGQIYHDNVAESTSNHQFYSKQKKIEAEYVRFYKEYKFTEDDMIDLIIQATAKHGVKLDRNQVKELFSVRRSGEVN